MTENNDKNQPNTSIIAIAAPSSDLHFYLIAFAIAACSPDPMTRALGAVLFAASIAIFAGVIAYAITIRLGSGK